MVLFCWSKEGARKTTDNIIGFSNSILWPLFHYHPGEMNFDSSHWLAYREANIRFADVVSDFVRTGDVVWVQDYHLMLLPMLLRSMISGESAQGEMTRREMGRVKEGVDDAVVRNVGMQKGVVRGLDEGVEMLEDVEEEGGEVTTTGGGRGVMPGMSAFQKQEIKARQRGKGNIRIGFFLHTPFPSSEIYRYARQGQTVSLTTTGFCLFDARFCSACFSVTSLGEPLLLEQSVTNNVASTPMTMLATSCHRALAFLDSRRSQTVSSLRVVTPKSAPSPSASTRGNSSKGSRVPWCRNA